KNRKTGTARAAASLRSVITEGWTAPDSIWLIAAALMPTCRASEAMVSPRCSRSALSAAPGSAAASAPADPCAAACGALAIDRLLAHLQAEQEHGDQHAH